MADEVQASGEHWSPYNAGIAGPGGTYWIVGRNMRIVATCTRPEDAERIVLEHEENNQLQVKLAKLQADYDRLLIDDTQHDSHPEQEDHDNAL
jgi:hypothetical protein